jgi:hypothetical protein
MTYVWYLKASSNKQLGEKIDTVTYIVSDIEKGQGNRNQSTVGLIIYIFFQ